MQVKQGAWPWCWSLGEGPFAVSKPSPVKVCAHAGAMAFLPRQFAANSGGARSWPCMTACPRPMCMPPSQSQEHGPGKEGEIQQATGDHGQPGPAWLC